MAEIRFTPARMQVVRDRLVEMEQQLNQSMTGTIESLGAMINVIQSSEVGSAIVKYRTAIDSELSNLVQNMRLLDEYLVRKINEYNQLNRTSVDALNNVKNMLGQI